jgi:hypothetical protein
MTKRDLEKVYFLKRELKMWEKRLEELYADISQDTKAADGMPHSVTNNVSSPTESKAIQIADHVDMIKGKQAEIRIAIREVEAFIVSIDDPIIRQVVEFRCAYCMKWEEVAEKVGNKNTAEGVRQMYHRFLQTINFE